MTARTEKLRARVLALRATGLSYAAIGRELGYSAQRCQQLATRDASGPVHPASDRGETVGAYLARRRREIESHARVVEAMVAGGLVE